MQSHMVCADLPTHWRVVTHPSAPTCDQLNPSSLRVRATTRCSLVLHNSGIGAEAQNDEFLSISSANPSIAILPVSLGGLSRAADLATHLMTMILIELPHLVTDGRADSRLFQTVGDRLQDAL